MGRVELVRRIRVGGLRGLFGNLLDQGELGRGLAGTGRLFVVGHRLLGGRRDRPRRGSGVGCFHRLGGRLIRELVDQCKLGRDLAGIGWLFVIGHRQLRRRRDRLGRRRGVWRFHRLGGRFIRELVDQHELGRRCT